MIAPATWERVRAAYRGVARAAAAAAVGAALASGTACQSEEYPAPILGSTYRIGEDEPAKGSEVRIEVLGTWNECADAKIDDVQACIPKVDRSNGEMQLSFMLRDPVSGQPMPRALAADQMSISHDGSSQDNYELIPHDPVSGGQLFIVLIDRTSTMYANNNERINKVYQALLTPAVIKSFYPDDSGKTGVVLLHFIGKEVKGLDGGDPQVIKSAEDYTAMVKTHLLVPQNSYTYLYDSVKYVATDLLALPQIDQFIALKGAEPTVVVLTDGFHNEAPGETCATNVPRLQGLLDALTEARRGVGAGSRTTVYTVGLGVAYRPGDKPSGFNQAVTPAGLCGKYQDYLIDPDLESAGIDHVSLAWIAEAGGGVSFTKKDSRGLADVFQKAASARYRWYELRYRAPDSFYHRKSFDVKLRLTQGARAETVFKVLPSPWLDAPSATRPTGEKWTRPTSFGHVFVVLMPVLGGLVFLTFVGPAWFNARRAIFRRARPRK